MFSKNWKIQFIQLKILSVFSKKKKKKSIFYLEIKPFIILEEVKPQVLMYGFSFIVIFWVFSESEMWEVFPISSLTSAAIIMSSTSVKTEEHKLRQRCPDNIFMVYLCSNCNQTVANTMRQCTATQAAELPNSQVQNMGNTEVLQASGSCTTDTRLQYLSLVTTHRASRLPAWI